MKQVLIVAYEFPPRGGVASLRLLKFVKYLPEFGWKPVVLTVQANAEYPHDPELERETPPGTPIHRIWHPDSKKVARILDKAFWPFYKLGHGDKVKRLPGKLIKWLAIPDDKIGSLPQAIVSGHNLIRRYSVDAIMTTGSPWTAHLIGFLLRKTTGMPWLADYRDPWSTRLVQTFPTRIHKKINRMLDTAVVRAADCVSAVSVPLLNELIGLTGRRDSGKFVVISNGYDPDDFTIKGDGGRSGDEKRLEIVHSGSLYGPQTGKYFLAALSSLIEAGDIPASNIRVSFVGQISTKDFVEYEGADWLTLPGYVSHRAAIKYIQSAGLLLLLVNPLLGTGATTGKVFEYIASGIPILALTSNESAAAKIIRSTQTGVVVDPEDIGQIRQALKALFEQWQAGQLHIMPNWEAIRQYDRRRLTSVLSECLDRMVEKGYKKTID